MRSIVAMVVVVLTVGCAAGVFAQNPGASIIFDADSMKMYTGTGSMMMPCAPNMPLTVGNLRILRVALPSDAHFEPVGLVMPQRGMTDDRHVALDNSWDSPQGLALMCEVIDPTQPIGFRLRADAGRRGDSGVWLDLMLNDEHSRVGEMPAVVPSRRGSGPMPTWYVEVDPMELDGSSEFAIVLDVGGHGSFYLKSIEIKSWPTRPSMMP